MNPDARLDGGASGRRRPCVIYACLIHETHTFLDAPTTMADFCVTLGDAVTRRKGDGSVIDGFLAAADEAGWDIAPTVAMVAMPGGIVEDAVLEYFWREFSERAGAALARGAAAIFLSLHGAMACASHRDVEGELLKRIRALPGAGSIPLFGSLDLHGNISRAMTIRANAMVAFRENPHTDARDTALRAGRLLRRSLESGVVPRMYHRGLAVMWAPPGTGTACDPMRSLESLARGIESADPLVWAVNVFSGYSFADTPDTGVSFSIATEGSEAAAIAHLESLARLAWEQRGRGRIAYPDIEAVLQQIVPISDGPVLLVEPADNIGGGAPGDGTGVLRALLERSVPDSLVVINDPTSAAVAAAAPVGAVVRLSVGGRGWAGDPGPVAMEATVVSCSDGRFDLEDQRSHLAASFGRTIEMGTCAVIRQRGVTVLLTSRKTPPFDLGQLRSQGIEPTRMKVIGVKAAVAHRQAYDPIARASHFVGTPGPCSSDLTLFPFRHLRRPIYPLDTDGVTVSPGANLARHD